MATKIAAFEYMIFKLMLDYTKNKYSLDANLSTIEIIKIFNEGINDFGKTKVDLFPFLVTIGNGKKDILLSLFDYNFIPSKFGFIQMDIHKKIEINDFKLFNFTDYNATVKEEFILAIINQHSKSIENIIIEDVFNITTNTQILTEKFEAITKSIDNITNTKLLNFANMNVDLLSEWSKDNLVYEIYSKFYNLETGESIIGEPNLPEYLKQAFISYKFELSPEKEFAS